MKKISIYFILSILLFTIAGFGIGEKYQSAQKTVLATTVAKKQTLTGISKLKSGTVKAIILGESIAVSQGASDPSKTGWSSDLNTTLLKTYSNKIVWDNKGSSGNLIDYCFERAKEIESTTDAVFICTGRIDRNFYTPEQFSEKYIQLIHEIKSKAPNADIFCIVEPPMLSLDESLFMGIRTAIFNVSSITGSNLLDVWSAFPQDKNSLGRLLKDVIHPNDLGNKLMSDYIYNQLVTVITTDK